MHDYWLACSNHRTVCIQAHDWNERVPFQGCNRPGTRLTYQEHQGYTKSSASFTGLPHHPDNSEGLHNWVDPQISFWTVPVSTQPKKSLLGHWEVHRQEWSSRNSRRKKSVSSYLFIYLLDFHPLQDYNPLLRRRKQEFLPMFSYGKLGNYVYGWGGMKRAWLF